jgi:AraC-like DNA-binding protein
MNKPKLIIYSQQHSDCPFFEIIFKSDFITETVGTLEELLKKIKTFNADAVIVCFCEAREENITELLPLESIPNLVPLIACSRTDSLDLIFATAQNGIDYFICYSQNKTKIVNAINKIIQHGGIKKFFEACYPDSFSFSPYTNKIIKIIVSAFPNRLNENEFARRIGVTPRWFRQLCIHVFKIKFSKLMRRIWIYQALRLMQLTNFDNTEIALLLNYSEEGSMVRDFRKELGYTPTKARKLLTNEKPEDMLKL